MTTRKHIVIVGCGRLGSKLANELSAEGHSLVVIDHHKASFDKLSVDFSGYKIVGDVTELQVLRDAEIRDADYFFATTSEDNINLMVAQIAQEIFKVPHVVARVFDPEREKIYAGFGIKTISPTNLSSNVFLQLVEKS